MKEHDATEAAYKNGYNKAASEILGEIVEVLQYEIDREEKMEANAWNACDATSVGIHQYAMATLENIKTAVEMYKKARFGTKN